MDRSSSYRLSLKRKSRHSKDGLSAINLTSMMDLMCVLLIIFIVAMPSIFASIAVSLPQIDANLQEMTNDVQYIDITIQKNMDIYVNDNLINGSEIISVIKSSADGTKGSIQIFLKADEECRYGDIVAIMSLLNKNGFQAISLLGMQSRSNLEENISNDVNVQ
jgi:biopolymer transport protein ExbD